MRLFAAPEALAAALLLRSQRLDVGAVLVTGIEQFSAYSVRPARSVPSLRLMTGGLAGLLRPVHRLIRLRSRCTPRLVATSWTQL